MAEDKPFRVLSLDGGGTRGIYTASYLANLASAFCRRRKVSNIDVGQSFDLIVGTSTGGILACGLAAGIPLQKMASLYKDRSKAIFRRRIPKLWGVPM